MLNRLTLTVPIVLALLAIIGFPLLNMAGLEIKSGYIVGVVVVVALLTMFILWRALRRFLDSRRRLDRH